MNIHTVHVTVTLIWILCGGSVEILFAQAYEYLESFSFIDYKLMVARDHSHAAVYILLTVNNIQKRNITYGWDPVYTKHVCVFLFYS